MKDSLQDAIVAMQNAQEEAARVRAEIEAANEWGRNQFPSSTTEP